VRSQKTRFRHNDGPGGTILSVLIGLKIRGGEKRQPDAEKGGGGIASGPGDKKENRLWPSGALIFPLIDIRQKGGEE